MAIINLKHGINYLIDIQGFIDKSYKTQVHTILCKYA